MIALAAANGDESKLHYMDAKTEAQTVEIHKEIHAEYSDKHFFSWWNKYRREQPDVFQ